METARRSLRAGGEGAEPSGGGGAGRGWVKKILRDGGRGKEAVRAAFGVTLD